MRAKYVFAEVLVGLWRNVTMTIAMIITMVVSLSMLGASLLLYLQVDQMKEIYYEQVEVSIFLVDNIKAEDRDEIESRLTTDELVKTFVFEDKEAAYEKFKRQFIDAPDFVNAVGPKELPESFRIKLHDPEKFTEINAKYKDLPGVQTIVDQKALVDKIFNVLEAIQSMSLVVAVFMGVAALLLVANTIQVAAYSKRREVAVMKLVGASNWFIQAPFVLEAIFAALLGSVLAWIMLILGKKFLLDGELSVLSDLLTPIEWSSIHLMLPVLAAIGGLVSAITGWITLRIYIKK